MKTKKYKIISYDQTELFVSGFRTFFLLEYCKDCAIITIESNGNKRKVITESYNHFKPVENAGILDFFAKVY